jgi:hypothetical protein
MPLIVITAIDKPSSDSGRIYCLHARLKKLVVFDDATVEILAQQTLS